MTGFKGASTIEAHARRRQSLSRPHLVSMGTHDAFQYFCCLGRICGQRTEYSSESQLPVHHSGRRYRISLAHQDVHFQPCCCTYTHNLHDTMICSFDKWSIKYFTCAPRNLRDTWHHILGRFIPPLSGTLHLVLTLRAELLTGDEMYSQCRGAHLSFKGCQCHNANA